MILTIDIETFCEVDLTKVGVHRYAEHKSFEILLFAYSVDDEPVGLIDLAQGDTIPPKIMQLLLDGTCTKRSYNAMFERICINEYLGLDIQPEAWECTMVKASVFGYPQSLDAVAKIMQLEVTKDKRGNALIRYFTMPCKPTISNGFRNRNRWLDNIEKWIQFKEYCRQDVVVEKAIANRLRGNRLTETERQMWALDQRINDTGVRVDQELVQNAIRHNQVYTDKLFKECQLLTSLENPNSPEQIKNWLMNVHGVEVKS